MRTLIETKACIRRRRKLLPDLEDDVQNLDEEHDVADVLCGEFYGMSLDAERFDANETVLIENVPDHVDEEEHDCLPKVRDRLGRKELSQIGASMPRAGDEGPPLTCGAALQLAERPSTPSRTYR